MKTFWLAACLFASTAFAQEIIINGAFPPRDRDDIEIIYPEGWKEENYEESFGTAGNLPMTGVKLRFKDAKGRPQEVWLYFSTERAEQ
jgi:hypothetical protein